MCPASWCERWGLAADTHTYICRAHHDLTALLTFRHVIPLYVQETDVGGKRLDLSPARLPLWLLRMGTGGSFVCEQQWPLCVMDPGPEVCIWKQSKCPLRPGTREDFSYNSAEYFDNMTCCSRGGNWGVLRWFTSQKSGTSGDAFKINVTSFKEENSPQRPQRTNNFLVSTLWCRSRLNLFWILYPRRTHRIISSPCLLQPQRRD